MTTVKVPPAVLDAAADRGLGEVAGMYRVAHGVSTPDQRRQSRRAEILKAILLLAGFSTPILAALLGWLAGGRSGLITGMVVGVVIIGIAMLRTTEHEPPDLDNLVYHCRHGFVLAIENQHGAVPFRWSDFVTVYQGGTSWFVYREHVATRLAFSLVHTDGRVVSFTGMKDGAYYEIVRWVPVLEAEITRELLAPLPARIRAGEQISFGAVTIGLNGITTPKGMTSWTELPDLRTATGYLVVGVGRRQWKHPVAKIPNFPVFWVMARHLFDSGRDAELDQPSA